MGRIYVLALEDVMGKNGLNAILNLAGLSALIDHYPPDNLERHFDFADFSALSAALEDMYGPRGGRGLALRAGRATFAKGLRGFGALAGASDLAFKVLPLQTKLKIGIPAMAKIFTQVSDQKSTVEEKDEHFEYIIHKCPNCWGRKADKPACHVAVGLLQEGLRWVSGGHEFRVSETKCIAMGNEACVFVIQKEPLG
jgi:predicted hydrocarbon binding protein